MSGGGMLPVGGFSTTAALRSGLLLPWSHSVSVASQALTTTKVWLIGSSATATVGITLREAVHITRVSCAGHCSAQVGTPTVSVTLWKTNQTAGSETITATSAATATGVGLAGWNSAVIVNSGKDAFAVNDVMLLSIESAATSATLLNLSILITGTLD